MKTIRIVTASAIVIGIALGAAYGDPPVITSFQDNGSLTATGATVGLNYSVQWSSSLTGTWANSWSELTDQLAASDTIEFTVPMFYRVAQIPDLTAPSNVSSFSATSGDQSVQLSWINPTDPDFQGVVVVRSSAGFPDTPTNGTVVYQGGATSFSDIAIPNGTTYYYRVFAYDGYTNYASGAFASGTPQSSVYTQTVTEVFSDSNGQNNLVDTVRTTAAYDGSVQRFLPAYAGPTDASEVQVLAGTSDTGYQLKKNLSVSGLVEKVTNEIRHSQNGWGEGYCYVVFQYSDGTAANSATSTVASQSYAAKTYTNPFFNKAVSNIAVYLRATLPGASPAAAWERNTVVGTVYTKRVLVVSNSSSDGVTLFARLDVSAVRETGDSIQWELTDNIRTNYFENLSTQYALSNSLTAPTRLRVIFTPSTNGPTPGGTGLISTQLRLWKQ